MNKIFCLIIIQISVMLNCSASFSYNIEHWPKIKYEKKFKQIADLSLIGYKKNNHDFFRHLVNYNAFGNYFNYDFFSSLYESNYIFDDQGIPKVKYEGSYHYNPVTAAQYALSLHALYLKGDSDALSRFFVTCDWIVSHLDSKGALRYNYNWKYYLTEELFDSGWVSGMAQGQALSVLARAYDISQSQVYLDAGNKILNFLLTPVREGGPMSSLADIHPSLSSYVFFEEYVTFPSNYTLNGYMFALIGLFDWSELVDKYHINNDTARVFFNSGIKTLEKLLPYYDIGGFSAYDLGHVTYNKLPHIGIKYHVVHIYLLHALSEIANSRELNLFQQRWMYFVEDSIGCDNSFFYNLYVIFDLFLSKFKSLWW